MRSILLYISKKIIREGEVSNASGRRRGRSSLEDACGESQSCKSIYTNIHSVEKKRIAYDDF
jgi:hypothetical protein